MATKKVYDLAVKTGSYTDKDGKDKGRWQNVGSVMQTDDGGKFIMLSRWFNPAGVPDLNGKGGESVLLSMFEPKPYGNAATPVSNVSVTTVDNAPTFDDDIPF